MNTNPIVSVVIPAYRRATMAREAVRSALAQTLADEQYEVILVDSTPSDEVRNAVHDLEALGPARFRYLHKAPEGPGPSRNLGARDARGQFIAFMDSDCQATPDWLRAGLAAFDPGVGLVQGRVLPDPTRPFKVFSHSLKIEQESFLYETANMLYRREAFEAAGGFPHDLTPTAATPMGGEDVALAWRVKRLGWQSRFATAALVYHEIAPLSPWRWVFTKRLFIFPKLVRDIPELRQFVYAGYFHSAPQAWLVLGLIGTCLTGLSPWMLLSWVPYSLYRGSEPTATLQGWRRPIRVAAYALRDIANFLTLLAGSVRFRAVLL